MVDVDKEAQNAKSLWATFGGNTEQRVSVEKAYLRDLVNMHAPVVRALEELQRNAQATGATLIQYSQVNERISRMEEAIEECNGCSQFSSATLTKCGFVQGELVEYVETVWRSILVGHHMRAGAAWDKDIKDALDRHDIGLCVVSPAFLTSDYITKVEIRTLLESTRYRGCCRHSDDLFGVDVDTLLA